MKLIKEYTEHDVQALTESVEGGGRSYYITGPFLQAEMRNRNGRVYPLQILQREVARYTKELIAENRAMGELGHPDTPSINLDRAAIKIVSLTQEGNNFFGKAKVMSEVPMGNIVKGLIDNGIKLGVSSRGLGTLKKTNAGNIVGEDFYLATAADVVADPSAPNAFVEGIMEGKEWVWENGILTEAQIAAYKAELAGAPKKQAAPRRLVESRTFAKFLNAIRVETILPKRKNS